MHDEGTAVQATDSTAQATDARARADALWPVERRGPGAEDLGYLSTHPTTTERITALRTAATGQGDDR